MFTKKHLFITLGIVLSGCAQLYSQYYTDNTGGKDISKIAEVATTGPELRKGNDVNAETIKMLEDGYLLLGSSNFYGQKIDESQAIEQAKKVKASIVIIYSKHKDTIYESTPPLLLLFGGIYTQTNIDRFDQSATYWAKRKPAILGILPVELTPEARKKAGSNKGILIGTVVKQTPAYSAEIINGDVLRKIDNTEINDVPSFTSLIHQKAGNKVTILLTRDGKEIVKEVKLNPAPQ